MKLQLFGCSHTDLLYNFYFKDIPSCTHHSSGGNSNNKIIDDVYNFIESDYKEGDVVVIQYTYTNRWWVPNNLPSNQFGFHSFDTSHAPIYTTNPSFMKDDLLKFYELYITYFWDYEPALNHLLKNISLLKGYLESKNVKYVHYLWTDTGHDVEWKRNSIIKDTTSIDSTSKYNDLNLMSIDGEYHIMEYAIKQGWLNPQEDSHIPDSSQPLMGKRLHEEIVKSIK